MPLVTSNFASLIWLSRAAMPYVCAMTALVAQSSWFTPGVSACKCPHCLVPSANPLLARASVANNRSAAVLRHCGTSSCQRHHGRASCSRRKLLRRQNPALFFPILQAHLQPRTGAATYHRRGWAARAAACFIPAPACGVSGSGAVPCTPLGTWGWSWALPWGKGSPKAALPAGGEADPWHGEVLCGQNHGDPTMTRLRTASLCQEHGAEQGTRAQPRFFLCSPSSWGWIQLRILCCGCNEPKGALSQLPRPGCTSGRGRCSGANKNSLFTSRQHEGPAARGERPTTCLLLSHRPT